jgi:hypothetical protein
MKSRDVFFSIIGLPTRVNGVVALDGGGAVAEPVAESVRGEQQARSVFAEATPDESACCTGCAGVALKVNALVAGLLEFQRRCPDFTPLVLCDAGREATAQRLGLPVQTWDEFLLNGPAG